jgi:hypothetical protein
MAGLAVRPSMSCELNIFRSNCALWLQFQLIDNNQKFSRFPSKCSPRTAAFPAVLEKVNTRLNERRRPMSDYRLRTVE